MFQGFILLLQLTTPGAGAADPTADVERVSSRRSVLDRKAPAPAPIPSPTAAPQAAVSVPAYNGGAAAPASTGPAPASLGADFSDHDEILYREVKLRP